MPFTLQDFAAKRPCVFHLTARSNLDLLRKQHILSSASLLFEEADCPNWLSEKRRKHVEVAVAGRKVIVRDQAPLHLGNMKLDDGWSFGDFIAHVNQRVFFWPGGKDGLLIDYGRRHYERYAEEAPVILRINTAELFATNDSVVPEFCRFNSGSPRCSNGKKSPRGANTFVTCDTADFGGGKVVEVTFPGRVTLPNAVEVGDSPNGPWTRL
jgi:hypothetical protein